MNWDAAGAIGEIAGAIGVVVTLFYFSRQIRNTITSQSGDSVSRAQEVELTILELELRYANLIVRANRGHKLEAEEEYQALKLYRSRWSAHLLEFIRTKTLGRQHKAPARNLARSLLENSYYKQLYDQTTSSPDPNVREFRTLVDQYLDKGVV